MARPIRVNWPGALYHITDRGNERKDIFQDDQDRRHLLGYFGKAVEKFRLRIHAFCLMPNHYHLEAETPEGNISEAMQWIKTIYTFKFNRRHERSGHLFQGRFKAILVEKESHLLQLTRYIHLNPVRAGLVTHPEEYLWSSYRDYVGMKKRRDWLETEWILERFGECRASGKDAYRRFVEDGLHQEFMNPLEETVAGVVLGSESFVQRVQGVFREHGGGAISTSTMKQLRRVSAREVIEKAGQILHLSEDVIRQRGCHGNEVREVAIYLACKHGHETNVSIGKEFGGITGTHIAYVSKKVKDRLEHDHVFRRLVKKVEENLFSDA